MYQWQNDDYPGEAYWVVCRHRKRPGGLEARKKGYDSSTDTYREPKMKYQFRIEISMDRDLQRRETTIQT